MTISIRITGLDEARTVVREVPKSIERTVILRMAQLVYDESLKGVDRHTRIPPTTGNLRASLYNRAIPNGREIGHDPLRAPYAPFVQFGTRPHDIRPKNKKALRWVSGNGFVFSKLVHNRGYRGDPYMVNTALNIALREFQTIVDQATREAA